MSQKRIFSINGRTLSLSSRDPEVGQFHLVLTQILMEIAAERETDKFGFSLEEIAQRLVAKGYDPETGERVN